MITHVGSVSIFVSDQDRALDFYVGKLGWEKRQDQPMGPGAPRWVAVAPRGARTALVLYKPTPEMPGASSYDLAKSLIGTFTPLVLTVDDMQATYQELSAKGVEFQDEPSQQFYGWWATIKDPDGNTSGLHQ